METGKRKTNVSWVEVEYKKALQSERNERQVLLELFTGKINPVIHRLIEKSKKKIQVIEAYLRKLRNKLACEGYKDDKIIATGSDMLSTNRTNQQNTKSKQKNKDKSREKKTKMVKVDKKGKRSKDEKAADKSKRFHRRLVSLFCFCVADQEGNDLNNETKQSTAEKTRNPVTID